MSEVEKLLEDLDNKIDKIKEKKAELKAEKNQLKEEHKRVLKSLEDAGISSKEIYAELDKIRKKIQNQLKKINIPEELLSE